MEGVGYRGLSWVGQGRGEQKNGGAGLERTTGAISWRRRAFDFPRSVVTLSLAGYSLLRLL